jgi:hypothetical protein
MVRNMSDDVGLYRPRKFNSKTRERFFRDRRARWAAHLGGNVTDTMAMLIDQAVGLEWDVRRLEAKELATGRLSAHDRVALAAWRRHTREVIRQLGPRVQERRVTIGELAAAHAARETKARRRSRARQDTAA